jgi:type II secretory pathway pseudopilin PulG
MTINWKAVLLILVAGGLILTLLLPIVKRIGRDDDAVSAIGALRTINVAQAAFAVRSGGRYATSLATLSKACPGSAGGFLPSELSQDLTVRSGYTIALASAGAEPGPNDCHGEPTARNYYATAIPLDRANPFFASIAGREVCYRTDRVPTVQDIESGEAMAVKTRPGEGLPLTTPRR